jgi:NADH-quinone oxidoreductase subunit A
MIPTAIVAYLALFAGVGFLFVLACLLLGKVLRSYAPTPQKVETYECGEPAIGPGSVQFDLRFYVVALVFLIFEVEMAFFFPPATVFGQATRLLAGQPASTAQPAAARAELGGQPHEPLGPMEGMSIASARTLAIAAMADLAIFFGVLLVGFGYVWSRGDLDWVRAVSHPAAEESGGPVLQLRGEP